jgi:protein-S-isoprenylcysteine O-methyltransferase Ste14
MMTRGRRSLGGLVFRWRSYLPLLAVVGLSYGAYRVGSDPAATTGNVRLSVALGLMLSACGLALRAYTVGQAPAGTSGRHRWQFAAALNTFGIYSVVRHPLYLGNMLIWSGVSLTSGWLYGALASAALGGLVFGLIVRHEDGFLRRSFGEEFAEWALVTPAFVPRPGLWRTTRRPFDWRRAVASEYSSLHTIGLLSLLFAALRGWGGVPSAQPSGSWWALLGANAALYLSLRTWRAARKRELDPGVGPGRGVPGPSPGRSDP